MAVRFNKSFNVNRLVKRIIYLIIGLLVGGLVLSAFVDAFRGYCSVLFNGLSILGVNITQPAVNQTAFDTITIQSSCIGQATADGGITTGSVYTIGGQGNLNSGILTVVGVIGVAGIIMSEFVSW